MNTKKLIRHLSHYLLLIVFALILCTGIYAQKDDAKNEFSLKDISEAILVNGKPTLKILSRKKGGYTEVKLLMRDEEEALVFDVVKMSMKNPVGKLFVTKTKVVFESLEKKQGNFNIDKTALKKSVFKKSLDGFPSIELEFEKEEAKLVIKFDRYRHEIDRLSQNAVHGLLYSALEDFEAALKQFKELTKSAYPDEIKTAI